MHSPGRPSSLAFYQAHQHLSWGRPPLQDVTPAQVGFGGFSRTIWQMVALWDGRLVGHGAAVRKMAAKNMASEVRRQGSTSVQWHITPNKSLVMHQDWMRWIFIFITLRRLGVSR